MPEPRRRDWPCLQLLDSGCGYILNFELRPSTAGVSSRKLLCGFGHWQFFVIAALFSGFTFSFADFLCQFFGAAVCGWCVVFGRARHAMWWITMTAVTLLC